MKKLFVLILLLFSVTSYGEGATKSLCEKFFSYGKSVQSFDTQAFLQYRAKHAADRVPINDWSQLQPEELLAILDVFSEEGAFEGIELEKAIQNLSPKQMNSLRSISGKFLDKGKFTGQSLKKFVARVFKITRQPKSLPRLVLKTKSFKLALEKLDEQKIWQYTEWTIAERGIMKAFKGIVQEPTLVEKFKQGLSRAGPVFKTTLFMGLWSTSMFNGAGLESFLPPYLFQITQISKELESAESQRILTENGREVGMQLLLDKFRKPVRNEAFRGLARRSYNIIFLTVFALTMAPEITGLVNMIQPPDVPAQLGNLTVLAAEAEIFLNDPVASGEAEFQNFISMNPEVDPNSLQAQAIRSSMIEAYAATMLK